MAVSRRIRRSRRSFPESLDTFLPPTFQKRNVNMTWPRFFAGAAMNDAKNGCAPDMIVCRTSFADCQGFLLHDHRTLRWELAAENIVVKIRWFGLLFGYLLVNLGDNEHRPFLNAILALGVGYTLIDTVYRLTGTLCAIGRS